MATPADEREIIQVPQVGEEENGLMNAIPRSILIGIIQPRLEETFELVRSRLESSGFDKVAGRRVVLTGGASQLSGVRELSALVLDKQVRMGRPCAFTGLRDATNGPALPPQRACSLMPSKPMLKALHLGKPREHGIERPHGPLRNLAQR